MTDYYFLALPAIYGLLSMLIKKCGSWAFALIIGLISLLIAPDNLPFFEKVSVLFSILLFTVWNVLSFKANNLERASSAFSLFGVLVGILSEDIYGVMLSLGLISVTTVGILFHGHDWRNGYLIGSNYIIFSALSLLMIVLSLAFGLSISFNDLAKSSRIGQLLLLLGLLSKLGLPVLNPSGYPLYSYVCNGTRLAFWSSVFKFFVCLIFLKVLKNLNPEVTNPLLLLISLSSLIISAGVLSKSEHLRPFIAASSMLSVSTVAFFASQIPAGNLTIYFFFYSLSTLVVLKTLDAKVPLRSVYPWLAGIGLLVAGGVSPLLLVSLFKFHFLSSANIDPMLVAISGFVLLGSTYFYSKQSVHLFKEASEKMPREYASLVLILVLFAVFSLIYPELFF
ncbi:MAG: hypothetical protein NZT61_04455 [Deltaproteobacteria bacterium]|nr:hypothetical protein [Deltaproteobacteria bacterium]MCX7952142.1 hypothetical protein [Deltaproteobacteria bacterium]